MLAFALSALIGIPFYGELQFLNVIGIIALLILGIFQLAVAYVVFAKGAKLVDQMINMLKKCFPHDTQK